jgi:hypothetical protein
MPLVICRLATAESSSSDDLRGGDADQPPAARPERDPQAEFLPSIGHAADVQAAQACAREQQRAQRRPSNRRDDGREPSAIAGERREPGLRMQEHAAFGGTVVYPARRGRQLLGELRGRRAGWHAKAAPEPADAGRAPEPLHLPAVREHGGGRYARLR